MCKKQSSLSNARHLTSKPCAWKRHGACATRPCWPWPRTHAWRGAGSTQPADKVSLCAIAEEGRSEKTYGLVLDLLVLAALESGAVALVLQALGSNQALDLGGLGVRLGALLLGLDLAADHVLADLIPGENRQIISPEMLDDTSLIPLTLYPDCWNSTTAVIGQAKTELHVLWT